MIDSACPHRGANLSNGKVKGENIQCPYHGWEYSCDGQLVNVPSCMSIPKNGDTESYDVVENGGFVWFFDKLDTNEQEFPTRYCDELFDDNWIKVYGSKDLDGRIEDWILNATDISHINYVHNFADEDNGIVKNTKIKSAEDYVDCFATVQPKASSRITQHMQPKDGAQIHSRFTAPATSIIRIKLACLLYTSPSPRDTIRSRMPSSA